MAKSARRKWHVAPLALLQPTLLTSSKSAIVSTTALAVSSQPITDNNRIKMVKAGKVKLSLPLNSKYPAVPAGEVGQLMRENEQILHEHSRPVWTRLRITGPHGTQHFVYRPKRRLRLRRHAWVNRHKQNTNTHVVAVLRGDSNVKGTVTFEQVSESDKTTIAWEITGSDANAERGFHIHSFGDNTNGCTSAGPHCMSTLPLCRLRDV